MNISGPTEPTLYRWLGLLSSIAVAFGACTARAQLVSFDFTGAVPSNWEDPNGTLAGLGITFPATVSGHISYDAAQAASDSIFSDATRGSYLFPAGVVSFSVTIGGHTFSNDPADPVVNIVTYDNHVSENDRLNFGFDTIKFDGGALPGGATSAFGSFYLRDDTRTALASDALPVVAPSLAAFPNLRTFGIAAVDGTGDAYNFFGDINSITPVPEPFSTAAALGLLGFALFRRFQTPKTRSTH